VTAQHGLAAELAWLQSSTAESAEICGAAAAAAVAAAMIARGPSAVLFVMARLPRLYPVTRALLVEPALPALFALSATLLVVSALPLPPDGTAAAAGPAATSCG
jgi:hypothetical protein